MPEYLYNSFVSYVYQPAGMQDTDTTVQLSDVALFPTVCNYRITIDNEIMLVTANVAGLLTVVRAQEDTVATAHANNAAVFLVMTAGGLDAVIAASFGGWAPSPSVCSWNQYLPSPIAGGGVFQFGNASLAEVAGPAVVGSVAGPDSGVIPGVAGVYYMAMVVNVSGGIPGDMVLGVCINGSPDVVSTVIVDSFTGYAVAFDLLPLSATDEIELGVSATVGGEVPTGAFGYLFKVA